MLEKKMIFNTGKGGKESFSVTTETEENSDIFEDSTDNLEKYIKDEFYLTLINRIKSEVKIALHEHILNTNPVSQSYNNIK